MPLSPSNQQLINTSSQGYLNGTVTWENASTVINNAVQSDINSGYLKSVGDGKYQSPDGTVYFINPDTGTYDNNLGIVGSQAVNSNNSTTLSPESVNIIGNTAAPVVPVTQQDVPPEGTGTAPSTEGSPTGQGVAATVNPNEDPAALKIVTPLSGNNKGEEQQAIQTSVQEFPDGSKLETFSDGSTLSTDTEGNQTFNSASVTANPDTANQTGGVATSVDEVRQQQTISIARNAVQEDDWRVRLSLAPGVNYLYNAAVAGQILYPLRGTDGVIFPYTPQIQTNYRANYDSTDITHSNYKMYFYKHSNVDEISLTADFTAQDTAEANYLLAVIHFFKSVTKMFYGQDGANGPKAGTPPPLCYLSGFGQYQFNEHPVLIANFQYSLPTDVDYIRAGAPTLIAGQSNYSFVSKENPPTGFDLMKLLRLSSSRLGKNTPTQQPQFKNYSSREATYVPTKMQIQLSLIPIVTRNDISNNFSLEKYATGELLKGRQRPSGGGIW